MSAIQVVCGRRTCPFAVRQFVLATLAAMLPFFVGACSDGSGGPEDAGSTSSASGTDADNAANFACRFDDCEAIPERVLAPPRPACPGDEPEEGAACQMGGLSCSYGRSAAAFCRRYYECVGSAWVVPENRQSICENQPADFCPVSPEENAECTVGKIPDFVPCEYPGAIVCYCMGNPRFQVGAPGLWECYGPPQNPACPELLPNIGDGCAKTAQFCSYGIVEQGCYAPYANVYCYQGQWEIAGATCSL